MSKTKKKRRAKMKFEPIVRVLKWDHPSLKTRCKAVGVGNAGYIGKMIRVLKNSKTGVGLAAPQIGVVERAILVWPKRIGKPRVMLNPKITRYSPAKVTASEGCLSYPGASAMVSRHQWVIVKWDGVSGQVHTDTFDGFEARIIQHEIDHLDGVCKVGDAWRLSKQEAAA